MRLSKGSQRDHHKLEPRLRVMNDTACTQEADPLETTAASGQGKTSTSYLAVFVPLTGQGATVVRLRQRVQEQTRPQGVHFPTYNRVCVMDWNRIEGNWKQFKGQVKEKWGRLSDDDLNVINGRQDQLEGKIQERYGVAKDQAKKDVDTWFKSLP
jgi:uncharacterized protein YjbJ (UPF0337 family)